MFKKAKWTFSGIKAHYPRLTFAEWLGICRRRDHWKPYPGQVVAGARWRNRQAPCSLRVAR